MKKFLSIAYRFELHFTNTSLDGLKSINMDETSSKFNQILQELLLTLILLVVMIVLLREVWIKVEIANIHGLQTRMILKATNGPMKADDDMIRGDDEVELTDEEFSNNEDEVAGVFRIDTNIFDFETPILMMNIRMIGSMNGTKIYHGLMRNHGLSWSLDETKTRPRERNINEYWWRIYKSGDLEVLES
ncbi:hypothetical protein Tco_0164009 [Tanacetum coccineum]